MRQVPFLCLADFVKCMKVSAADIVVIAQYKANVEYGNRCIYPDYLECTWFRWLEVCEDLQ